MYDALYVCSVSGNANGVAVAGGSELGAVDESGSSVTGADVADDDADDSVYASGCGGEVKSSGDADEFSGMSESYASADSIPYSGVVGVSSV